MNKNSKLGFYLQHRALIEEWASIRDIAATELDLALESAASLLADEDVPAIRFRRDYGGRGLALPVGPGVEILLWWKKDDLFRARGERRFPNYRRAHASR